MESVLFGRLQWSLTWIQDLDAPARFSVISAENVFQTRNVCTDPVLRGLRHTDVCCPQLPAELRMGKMPFHPTFMFSSFTASRLFPDLQAIHTVEVSLSSTYQTFICCDRVVIFQSYEFEACSKEASHLLWLSDSRLAFMKLIHPRRHLILSTLPLVTLGHTKGLSSLYPEFSYWQHCCWSYAQFRQKSFYSVSVSWDFHIGSLLWHHKLNVSFITLAVQVFPCRVTVRWVLYIRLGPDTHYLFSP